MGWHHLRIPTRRFLLLFFILIGSFFYFIIYYYYFYIKIFIHNLGVPFSTSFVSATAIDDLVEYLQFFAPPLLSSLLLVSILSLCIIFFFLKTYSHATINNGLTLTVSNVGCPSGILSPLFLSLLPSPFSLLPSPFSLLPSPFSLLPSPLSLCPSLLSLSPSLTHTRISVRRSLDRRRDMANCRILRLRNFHFRCQNQ
jgi:hypothetical protein